MHNRLKKILILDIFLIFMFCVFFLIVKTKEEKPIETSLDSWKSNYIEYQNGGWQIGNDWVKTYGRNIILLYGPYVDIQKGDYTVTITYQCEVDQSLLITTDNPYAEYIKADEVTLDKAQRMMSYDFRVTENIEDLEVLVYYNGEGNFSVSQIRIEKNDNGLKRMFAYLLLILIIVNMCIWYKSKNDDCKMHILLILAISLLSSLPLFFKGLNDYGQDLMFHLMRIEGIVKELKLGNFPVRISSAWLGEYGYPVSIYYGDALLYIPAVLRLIGFSVNEAYKIFVFFVNLLTVIISEQCFEKIIRDQKISLILALVYTTSSYRLLDVYVRSAVGEYIALMFLPLIILALYRIYKDENTTIRENFVNATIMAVGMAGVITSHVLSAEMIAFVIAMVCVICLKKTLKVNTIRTYLIAVCESLVLSVAFLVPFIDYYINEDVSITYIIKDAFARRIQSKGCNIGDYFDFFSNPFSGTNGLQFNPGLILMIFFLLTIVLCLMGKSTRELKAYVLLAVILIIMSLNVFPWNTLSYNFKIINILAQVQFPWRYVGLVSAVLTLLMGIVMKEHFCENVFKIKHKTVLVLSVAISVYTMLLFVSYYTDYAKNDMYYDLGNLETHDVGNGEYQRTGADDTLFDGKIKAEAIESIDIIARKGCELDISCKTGAKSGYVELPVANYRGYVLTDDNDNQYQIEDGYNACISFYVPEGFEGEFYLRYKEPWYWTASLVVSVISILFLTILFVREKYKLFRG